MQDQRVGSRSLRAGIIGGAVGDLDIARRMIEREGGGIIGGDLEKGALRAARPCCGLEGGETVAREPAAPMRGVGGERQQFRLACDRSAKGKGARIAAGNGERACKQGREFGG